MKTVICQPQQAIADFVSMRTRGRHLPWGNFSAIALIHNGEIAAGVVYNHWSEANVCMHVGAVLGRHWLIPEFLFAAFDYPFRVVGVRRITGLVPTKNTEAQKFDEHLGFVREGLMRQALPEDDMLVYGMLRSECKWISDEFCGRLQRRLLRRLPTSTLAAA